MPTAVPNPLYAYLFGGFLIAAILIVRILRRRGEQ